MTSTAEKSDPALWETIKAKITEGSKGGKPGQWSARKAQLATHDYQEAGGGYVGRKDPNNGLHRWTAEEWGTKSGERSEDTGERYLPKRAREHLTDAEYRRTSAKKRRDTKEGRQFSAQPADVADKTSYDRAGGGSGGSAETRSKSDLYAEAQRRDVPGRSRMTKAELARALR